MHKIDIFTGFGDTSNNPLLGGSRGYWSI